MANEQDPNPSPLENPGAVALNPGKSKNTQSFLDDVLVRHSIFITQDSLSKIQTFLTHSNSDLKGQVIAEPCDESTLVCSNRPQGNSTEFTFFYETFVTKLKVRLPLTEFETKILNLLNVAPSQLHPNSWGFVKAFVILCKYHGITPTPIIFFHFFQAKYGTDKPIGWTSLNGIVNRGILVSIASSYKEFKEKKFRVRGVEDKPSFLFGSDNSPNFPLYWIRNPRKMLGYKRLSLTDSERADVDLLTSYQPLSCTLLLEIEGDDDLLSKYMVKVDEMASKSEQFQPRMDDKALLAFKRKKGNSQNTTSKDIVKVIMLDGDQEASSTTKLGLPVKKARSDHNDKTLVGPNTQSGPTNATATRVF